MLTLFPDWFQETSPDNRLRYVLGRVGEFPLITIGLNPSTAAPGHPDPTIKAVERHSIRLGYHGWVMLNLYPLRETNPAALPPTAEVGVIEAAVPAIIKLLEQYPKSPIWAAWGAHLHSRSYLLDGLKTMIELPGMGHRNWLFVGDLTQGGHPRHPLYLAGNKPASAFDVIDYYNRQLALMRK